MTALWWQNGVFYQIYPRSFQDSNDDGLGDLKGIERRLDYLVSLGVDALWISPIYPSPMIDFGYDVADYCDVDPRFGTLAPILTISLLKPISVDLRSCSTSCLTIRLTYTPGLPKAALRATMQNEIGIFGVTLPPMGHGLTIGSAISAARLGNGTKSPANFTTTPF